MVFTLAGLWNSGPHHWQTHWERAHPARFVRVPHREWSTPDRAEWVDELERALAECVEPPVLAAHSTACALVAHWARTTRRPQAVRGAFLVGPSDVEAASYPKGPTGFAPMPLVRLACPSLVVASTNDPYVSLERAKHFAQAWGSELVTVENGGHLNGDSGHGPWPEGLALLDAFEARLAQGA